MVQKIRISKTQNDHKGEPHVISPYAYYFYSVDLGKYLTRIIEKYNKKYEVEMLLGSKNGQRVYLRFDYIKEGIMQIAKYLVDNKAAITAKLKEMKKPTLAKLEMEKERLYRSLEGLPLSERLETYGHISDVRLSIEKLAKLYEMIENYMRIARKLSNQYDTVLAKELFSSFVAKGFDDYLIVSLGGDEFKSVPMQSENFHTFDMEIIHLFKVKTLKIHLYVN